MSYRILCLIFLFLLNTVSTANEDQFDTERLPIGNPETKYNYCAVKLDRIFDTNANTEVTLEQLIERFNKFRIIMLGESHTNELHHEMQLNIIKGLFGAGLKICLALEMFNESQDAVLDDYIYGKITEEEFLDQSDYFNTWGHNYRYYKPIFNFARENKIRIFGINIKHEYASKIGSQGISSLSPAEKQAIPGIDTTDIEHRFYIKTAMEGMDALSPGQFSKIYAAQCLWDAAMGDGAIKVAKENPESTIIILAGSGHVAYNLGIGRIIKKRSDLTFSSVIAIDVPDTIKESAMMKVKTSLKKEKKEEDEKKSEKEKKMPPMAMMHGSGAMGTTPYKIVVRSLADFLWGVHQEKQEKYPSFGFSIEEKNGQGFMVKRVIPETIAEEKGIRKGDVIISIDDKSFPDMAKLKKYLSFKDWNENISFKILRDSKEIEIKFLIEPNENQ